MIARRGEGRRTRPRRDRDHERRRPRPRPVKRAADLGVDRYTIPPLGFDLETLRTHLGTFSENVIANA